MKKDKLENISIEVSELEERIIELEYQIRKPESVPQNSAKQNIEIRIEDIDLPF